MTVQPCKKCGRPSIREADGEIWCAHCTPIVPDKRVALLYITEKDVEEAMK